MDINYITLFLKIIWILKKNLEVMFTPVLVVLLMIIMKFLKLICFLWFYHAWKVVSMV